MTIIARSINVGEGRGNRRPERLPLAREIEGKRVFFSYLLCHETNMVFDV